MKKSMMKYFAFAMAMVLAVGMLCGCGGSTDNGGQDPISASYESEDGWKVSFDPDTFTMNEELGDGAVGFSYTGETSGTDSVIISYVSEKMPDEVLYDKVAEYDDSQVKRSEGMFGGNGYWAHTRTVNPQNADAEAGDALNLQYTAIEHNGGSVLVEIVMHAESDEAKDMEVSDALAGIVDTLELVNHEPQTEYAHVPGTYSREYKEEIEGSEVDIKDTVVLNEDHTCSIDFQDTVTGTWTGEKIFLMNGDEIAYTVEGDALYLDEAGDSNWIEYTRE